MAHDSDEISVDSGFDFAEDAFDVAMAQDEISVDSAFDFCGSSSSNISIASGMDCFDDVLEEDEELPDIAFAALHAGEPAAPTHGMFI